MALSANRHLIQAAEVHVVECIHQQVCNYVSMVNQSQEYPALPHALATVYFAFQRKTIILRL